MRKGELVPLILTVCPNIKEQPGKVTLISRFGADNVETMLPAFIKEVQVSDDECAHRSSCVHLVGKRLLARFLAASSRWWRARSCMLTCVPYHH